ncbi:MAG: DUF1573 domain-containing protein [Saprospiraceae bacterium]
MNKFNFSGGKLGFLFYVSLFLLAACGASNEPTVPSSTIAEAQGGGIIKFPVSGDGTVDTMDLPKIRFSESSFNFGAVDEGAIVSHRFSFKNTGKQPLVITRGSSTCGCTVPEFPRTPIAPGDTSSVKVVFNTDNKSGPQKKPVTLTANTYPSQTTISLIGIVDKRN